MLSFLPLDLTQLIHTLPPRAFDAHKHSCGHLLIIGGDTGMPGAVLLAAKAALRMGAGLVSIATHPDHAHYLPIHQPELMSHAISEADALVTLLKQSSAMVVGPGCNPNNPWSRQMIKAALQTDCPLVIDAGALAPAVCHPQSQHFVATPHAGEAARLLDTSSMLVNQDRQTTIQTLQQHYGGCWLLKGPNTLLTNGTQSAQCPYGTPALATAGTGDVLSGMIGALLAQGVDCFTAASISVCMHARAGELAETHFGTRSVIASDVITQLAAIWQEKQK